MVARNSAGLRLDADQTGEIIGLVQEQSVVQQLATRVPVSGRGSVVSVVTGDPVASFVTEGGVKPATDSTITDKVLRPYTVSVIQAFSNELKRDRAGLYNELVTRLPGSIAKAFDQAVLYGQGAPGSDFDTLAAAPTTNLNLATGGATPYKQLLASIQAVAANGGDLDGFAVNPAGEIALLGALDTTGRPLFATDLTRDGRIGAILGRPVYKSKGVNPPAGAAAGVLTTLGFGGDWSRAVWGQVNDIEISEHEGAIDLGSGLVSLWQKNMFALRFEAFIGFRYASVNDYNRITSA